MFRVIVVCVFLIFVIACSGGLTVVQETVAGFVLQEKSNRYIDTTFLNEEICLFSEEQLVRWFDELERLKIQAIIINNLQVMVNEYESRWMCKMPELLLKLLDLAEQRYMKVYVGLVIGMHVKSDYYNAPLSDVVYQKTVSLIEYLKSSGVLEKKSFAGWYVPDEPALGCWNVRNNTSIVNHYQRIVKFLKQYSTKMVLVSPYFCADRDTPQAVGENVKYFVEQTGVDVLVWQDGVGAYSDLKDLQKVSLYLKEIEMNIGKSKLWVLIELFNDLCSYKCNKQDYNATHGERVKEQVRLFSLYGDRIVCWAQPHHLSDVSQTSLAYGGDRLKREYVEKVLLKGY